MLSVLRLGHRHGRDARLSTHVGLTARALGADEIIYTGEHDVSLINSIQKITDKWGGGFSVRYEKNWKSIVAEYKKKGFVIVHLTMYGINLPDVVEKIKASHKTKKNLLVVVGGEKVPSEMYQLADFNVAVGNQPHSEVAALAIFLDRIQSTWLDKKFNGKIRIVPQERGKKLEED